MTTNRLENGDFETESATFMQLLLFLLLLCNHPFYPDFIEGRSNMKVLVG
jgi:hypothetical protein